MYTKGSYPLYILDTIYFFQILGKKVFHKCIMFVMNLTDR